MKHILLAEGLDSLPLIAPNWRSDYTDFLWKVKQYKRKRSHRWWLYATRERTSEERESNLKSLPPFFPIKIKVRKLK